MFDIITTELDDNAVSTAVSTVAHGAPSDCEFEVASAHGNFVLTVPPRTSRTEGDGGASRDVLVIVGHGSANGLSKCATWADYKKQFEHANIDWTSKKQVYIVSCSTAADSNLAFFHGNFANEVKNDFKNATVWASSTVVNARTLEGTWQKL